MGGTKALLFIFLASISLVLTHGLSFGQPIEKKSPVKSQETVFDRRHSQHNFYLGAKVGLVYVLGIETTYIIQTKNVNRTYLAAAIQSSFIVNSANIGGGVFLGRTGVGLGCRYLHLLWIDSEKESKIQPGYGPEVVYNKTIGTKYIINLHAGGIISEGSFFPDVSFGVFLPLN